MSFRFENLDVWKEARSFVNEIYAATRSFPKSEIFGLRDQIRRAATSVVLNIAEGATRKSDREFTRFLRVAQGSLSEVATVLYLALDQRLITQTTFNKLYQQADTLGAKLGAFINKMQ